MGPEPLDLLVSQSLTMAGSRRDVSLGNCPWAVPHGSGLAETLNCGDFCFLISCGPFLKSLLNFWVRGGGLFWAMRHVRSQLPDQGSNLQPLRWKVKSQPLDHQGSPGLWGLKRFRQAECLGHSKC